MSSPAPHLPNDATDEQVLTFVDGWVADLARGDFDAALSNVSRDPYYRWTPELVRDVIAGYGLPDPGGSFRVTSGGHACGTQHHRSVVRGAAPGRAIAMVLYDLPLNGAWSDLTVTFRVEAAEAGLQMVLEDIHVF